MEPPQHFDILAVDAFSSDAIPVHLLTTEALREYFRHLKPDGILAAHISNRFLNLEWVVRFGAEALGKSTVGVFDENYNDDPALSRTDWMLVTGKPGGFEDPKWRGLGLPSERPRHVRLWTDDYSNVLAIMR
jgi:SAM-dependent methyltransferase